MGSVGSYANGHTTVVSLLGGTLCVVTANGTDDQVLAALGFVPDAGQATSAHELLQSVTHQSIVAALEQDSPVRALAP